MLKPKLQNSALPSTAVSKNLLSNTHVPFLKTTSKSSLRDFNYPMISSFYKGSIKIEQPKIGYNQQLNLQKESKPKEDNSWVNTSDIESIIRKRIDADAELSIERNFSTQKYFLGPQRICPQKILSIPIEIKSILQEKQQEIPQDEKVHLVYGYLASLNAIYYIIEQELYIFNIVQLKNRTVENIPGNLSQQIVYKPTKLRPNCRKIYQVEFPIHHSYKMIPKQFNGKVLILEYPYEIELCCYMINKKNSNQEKKQGQREKPRNFLTLVSLNAKIPLETTSAEFITITQKGQLLYLDEKGKVVCFQFSKMDDTKLKRKTHQQSTWKKKAFVSRNRGFLKAAKNYFWQILDFGHSIYLPRKRNLSMIYDSKRNRIYTLTMRGDRTTMIQQMRKQIRVYEFLNTDSKVELNCLLSIPESELLTEIGIQSENSRTNLFTILKADADYNQESDLIALLSNGTKVHIRFGSQNLKLTWVSLCPDIEGLKRANKQRKKTLMEICKNFLGKDQSNTIQRSLSEKYEIPRCSHDMKVKAFFNDRSLSIGLVRMQKQYLMYMTMKRSIGSSDEYDVYPISWKKQVLFHDTEKFPTENEIFMTEKSLHGNLVNDQINQLQKYMSKKSNNSEQHYSTPHPITNNSHQLLRQVHHSPCSFIYLTNKFITNFTLLRPIDILFMMVTTRQEMFCEMYLPAILGLEPYEICCMLLQLYSVKDAVYYKSSNYAKKLHLLIEKLKQNTKIFQTLNEKSILSRFSTSSQIATGQKQIFEQKSQDQLQFSIFQDKGSQQMKIKIRHLFATFSKLQNIKDPNAFERIKLRFSTNEASSQVEDKIDKLNEEHKGQAQYCLLYISRVFYPFWGIKIASNQVSRDTLHALKEKITQMFGIVDLLKIECNEYWKHLKNFLKKLIQIVEMCIHLSQLPADLTLENAVSKQPAYFQPYIFGTIRRQSSPQILRVYVDKFPFYLNKYFETLIKIFMEARLTVNVEQIKSMLGRLPQYPDYFFDFLREEKGFNDLSFLKKKGEMGRITKKLSIPDLPFQNLIQYLHSRVRNSSVKMPQKFQFLKEARKRLNSYKSSQLRQVQVFSPYVLQKLQKQYDELFKCLKLQEQCKNEIIRIAEEASNENKQSSNEQNSGFFSKLLSKISISSQNSDSGKQTVQNRLSLITKRQNMRKMDGQNQEIFRKLNYLALPREDLRRLILQIKCPRLRILHLSMFLGRGVTEAQKQNFRVSMYTSFCEILNEGAKKYKIQTSSSINERANFSKFVNFIRCEIKKIYLFLNMTKTPLFFSPLYKGIKHQMIKREISLKFIIQNVQECIYSVGRELAQLGYDKNIVLNHIYQDNIHKNFIRDEQQGQDENEFVLKNLVYDWYMGVDVAKKFKKQSLDNFYRDAKTILQSKQKNLQSRPEYKRFFEKGMQTLFNIINGNHENEMERKTIIERLMNKLN